MIEAVVGFFTGIIASMGLGGGFILMIWLTVFADIQQKTAQGINVLFFLPAALISVIIHLRSGFVDKKLVLKCAVGGVIGTVAGALASSVIPSELLRKLYALFLLFFGLRELFRKPSEEKQDENSRNCAK